VRDSRTRELVADQVPSASVPAVLLGPRHYR